MELIEVTRNKTINITVPKQVCITIANSLFNQISELPTNYWKENDTENYFFEEETNIILTLEDL